MYQMLGAMMGGAATGGMSGSDSKTSVLSSGFGGGLFNAGITFAPKPPTGGQIVQQTATSLAPWVVVGVLGLLMLRGRK